MLRVLSAALDGLLVLLHQGFQQESLLKHDGVGALLELLAACGGNGALAQALPEEYEHALRAAECLEAVLGNPDWVQVRTGACSVTFLEQASWGDGSFWKQGPGKHC